MGHKGALGKPPSYWRQHVHALIVCLICLAIPGYQQCSCKKDQSNGHGLGVLHLNDTHLEQQSQCAFSTTKSSRSSFFPLGVECIDRGHFSRSCEILTWFLHTIHPSSLEMHALTRIVLRSAFFLTSIASAIEHLVLGLPVSAVAKLMTCISTRTCPVATTCTSFSMLWSPSTTGRVYLLLPPGWCPRITQSRMDCTWLSGPRQVANLA